ncbi:MAG: phosphoglucomutase [Tenuifilum sp.]|jgi:phosphoglucomutase|uniref:phospho-sugar mutase n=1 Tax=Tenuifilum sp. TaxID=2760880 RepID=UPI0024AB5C18|nr:phospho-sugar mutase [Tenuifilum sp.]MDI3526156.1 phosphoglucomutase [Tenuifilum sp.]
MLDNDIIEKAKQWLSPSFDEETRKKVKELIENDPKELTESFYRDLEFGTGGLRGIMGVGTNRMNRYTVGMATQGLSNYLKKHFAQLPEIRAAIAYDSRNNSPLFAEIASKVLSANGIKVYLFDSLRPTPELSFAIRSFKCHCGIVITASHNPKEYNGYKVYWEDGGQIVPPHDKGIIEEVKAITNIEQVNFNGNEKLIVPIGKEIDEIYLNTLSTLSLSPEVIRQYSELPIVYTPIHGTGVNLVPMALKKFGFKNVITVEEQCKIDGNFPTVASPNPEERSAMQLAIEKAKAHHAEIAMATDPDSDRVGIGVRKPNGDYVLLNGNQAASILIYYILNKWHEHNKISGNEFLVKTIVTTDLISAIAHDFGVDCYEVLTGFKYIAEKIREQEGVKKFIAGGEESYGYLYGDFVRDKDAVLSCAMFAEITAWAKSQDKTLLDILYEIYTKYGLYKEHLVSLTRKGIDGLAEIKSIMEKFRSNPPKEIGSSKVVTIFDYLNQVSINVHTGKEHPTNLPKSDVLQFITENGTKVSVRPSGTEPKIKFYISVKGQLDEGEDIDTAFTRLDKSIENIVTELNLK